MVSKDPDSVRRMFASIAPQYDRLNHLLSLSIDRLWRRKTVRLLGSRLPPEARLLDVCSGTGDLAFALTPTGRVVGVDFCHPMLVEAGEKRRKNRCPVPFVEADALRLPFRPEIMDGVTIAFGLRNLADYRAGLREMTRLLRPGGRLAVLEFSIPSWPGLRHLYLFYFTRVLPRIGALVSGQQGPYSYLPESVREFPEPEELADEIRELGHDPVEVWSLSGGIATLYIGRKTGSGE